MSLTAERLSGTERFLGMEHPKLLFKVNPEADAYLVQRDIQVVVRSIMFGILQTASAYQGQRREQSLTT